MSERYWCIGGCVSTTEEFNTLVTGLHGGPVNRAILHPWNYNTLEIAGMLLSLDRQAHRRISAECEKIIEKKMQGEHDRFFEPPNYGDIQNKRVTRKEQVSTGFLGLKKKTVTKEETVPNPDFQEFLRFLNGESFFSLNSFRGEREETGLDIEYDDAYLLTASGRILNLKYEVSYLPRYDARIRDYTEVKFNDEKANILLAGNISRYIGLDSFKEMLVL